MAKLALLEDLRVAIEGIELIRPYSTTPEAGIWRSSLKRLKEVEAVLLMMHIFKPSILVVLEAAALEELQVAYEEPIPEVTALVKRHSKKRERLR